MRRKDCAALALDAALAALLTLVAYAVGVAFSPAAAQVPPQAAPYRLTLLREAQRQWGLDAPVAALAAQVQQESGWNPQAVSRVGARGMAQFMPATAAWWCARTGTAKDDCLPHNPTWALRAMVGYDVYLFARVPAHHSRFDRLWLALRGYNGGEANLHAEARAALLPPLGEGRDGGTPTREQIDAACGQARRAAVYCRENLGYPRRILVDLQPRYASWGQVWEP